MGFFILCFSDQIQGQIIISSSCFTPSFAWFILLIYRQLTSCVFSTDLIISEIRGLSFCSSNLRFCPSYVQDMSKNLPFCPSSIGLVSWTKRKV